MVNARSVRWIVGALGAVALWCGVSQAEFGGRPGYAGSDRCKECHEDVWKQWKLTAHANMLVNTERDPAAVHATDFGDDIPFSKEEIAYTVGSHWVQKYITRIDGVLYVLPKYWNVTERRWEPYSIWNWRDTPYNLHCDGCHTVGFEPTTKSFFEPAIGCESCHGPGLQHVQTGGKTSVIVNPAKLSTDKAQMVCMQCHTDGRDKQSDAFPFPVGYTPGKDLRDYYSDFFMPKPKSKSWYWGTMDFLERKRMYYFFQSKFYSTNRACEVCGFDRGTGNKKERYMTRNEYCGTCHKTRFEGFEKHSGHKVDQVLCIDCHNPKTTNGGNEYSIHDHKFDFSRAKLPCSECHDVTSAEDPAVASVDKTGKSTLKPEPEHHDFHFQPVKYPKPVPLPEACLSCHKEKDVGWAKQKIATTVDVNMDKGTVRGKD